MLLDGYYPTIDSGWRNNWRVTIGDNDGAGNLITERKVREWFKKQNDYGGALLFLLGMAVGTALSLLCHAH